MTPKFKVWDVVKCVLGMNDIRRILFVGKTHYLTEGVEPYFNPEEAFHISYIDSHYALKPKEITISKEDLAKAWDVALMTQIKSSDSYTFDNLCKELGLE